MGQRITLTASDGFKFNAYTASPAGTPRDVVARVNAETVRILALPEIKANYANLGMTAVSSMPEQFSAYVQEEIARWAQVVKASGARAD